MFSSFNDPFFNDPFFNSSSPLLLTPFPRLMGNTGNQGGMMNSNNTSLTAPNNNNNNTSLQQSNFQNPSHQWLNWNHLFEDPLQLGLNDKGDSYELMTRRPTGLRKKDVHLEIHDNVLTISGEREKHKKNRANNMNEERSEWVSFSRSLVLPNDIDPSKITAKYDDSQELHVELPKKPGSGRRSIEIQGSTGMDQKDQQRSEKTLESANLGSKQQTESDKMQVDKEQGTNSGSMRKTSEPRSQTHRIPISK